MAQDILFETDRFNLSESRANFINPCCFGEDLAAWLRTKLAENGVQAHEPGQEDWGWYTGASMKGSDYFIAVGGNVDQNNPNTNYGEWRIGIEKRRSLWDKLTGRNKMLSGDPMVEMIFEILASEPDFVHVHRE